MTPWKQPKKGEGAVNCRTVTKWFQKFHWGCKKADNQTKSSRPNTLDLEAELPSMEANLIFKKYKASLVSHSSAWLINFTTFTKIARAARLWLTLPKILQNF